jgi:hypothetical protein
MELEVLSMKNTKGLPGKPTSIRNPWCLIQLLLRQPHVDALTRMARIDPNSGIQFFVYQFVVASLLTNRGFTGVLQGLDRGSHPGKALSIPGYSLVK